MFIFDLCSTVFWLEFLRIIFLYFSSCTLNLNHSVVILVILPILCCKTRLLPEGKCVVWVNVNVIYENMESCFNFCMRAFKKDFYWMLPFCQKA